MSDKIELRERTESEKKSIELVKNTIEYYIKHYYPSRFDIIKAKQLFAGDEKKAIRETIGSVALNVTRHSLLDSVHDAYSKELMSDNFTPKLIPLHPSKRQKSYEAQMGYDWMYTRSKFETSVAEKVYTEASLIGDSYVFFGKKMSGDIEVPTAEHISFFEMFVEPMATSFESSRKKIVRKIVESKDILNKFGLSPDGKDIDEGMSNVEFLKESVGNVIFKTEFKKVWDIAFYEKEYVDNVTKECEGIDGDEGRKRWIDYISTGRVYEDMFSIGNDSTLCELVEIWTNVPGGYQREVLVNGFSIPGSEIIVDVCPFGNIYYEENIGSPIHRGLGHKLMSAQRECDLLQFVITNGIKMHAFPDWITDGGVQDADNQPVKNLNWSGSQKVYQSTKTAQQGKQPFRAIEYISNDVLSITRLRLNETIQAAYEHVGLNSYISGGDGRVERVRSLGEERIKQSRARLKTIKNSISTSLNTSFYVWITILNSDFGKKLLEKVTSDGKVELTDLDVSSIKDSFEVMISSEGQHEDTLKDMGQNVLNTMNTIGQYAVDSMGQQQFDNIETLNSILSLHGASPLKVLTKEEKIARKKKDNELALELAKLDVELQKSMQEIMPPPPPAPGTTPVTPEQNPGQPVFLDEQGNVTQ